MSVQTMAAVWKGSQHSGSALLMMLAIADFSDDRGVAYPAVSTLAEKTRMKPRNANYLLSDLQASGELAIKIGEGPKGTNLYRIVLSRLHAVQPVAGLHRYAGLQQGAGVQADAGLQRGACGAALECADPLHPSADKPSLNHQEPSEVSANRRTKTSIPDCPCRDLLALFAAAVPELPHPRPELWTGKRVDQMRNRWQWVLTATRENGERYATTAPAGVEWFGKFFKAVSASDFLTGRNGRWANCTLEWLMSEMNFAKVVDGHYRNEVPA